MKRYFLVSASLFLAIFAFISCNYEKSINTHNNTNLVSYHSKNSMSVHAPFVIKLKEEIVSEKDTIVNLSKFCFIEPNIDGKWHLEDSRTIYFTPKESLDFDKNYRLKIELDKLKSSFSKDNNILLNITTNKLHFQAVRHGIQSYSKKYQYLNGSLQFSDKIKNHKIRSIIESKFKNAYKKIKWLEPKESLSQVHTFIIDSIERSKNDNSLEVFWNGSKINAQGKGNWNIPIYALEKFKVLDTKVSFDNGTQIEINFSDKIKKNQNFKSFIQFSDIKFTTQVSGNKLLIYPQKNKVGKFLLRLSKNIKNTKGNKMLAEYSKELILASNKPDIRILQSGNILSSLSSSKLHFESTSLKKIDLRIIKISNENILQYLQDNTISGTNRIKYVGKPVYKTTLHIENANGAWKTHSLDLKKLFNMDPNAIYRADFFIRPSYSTYNCEVSDKGFTSPFDVENFNNPTERSHWNYYDDYYYDNYKWRERENPCHISYFLNRRKPISSKNILTSDIGISAKRTRSGVKIILVNTVDNSVYKNALVKIYNFQKEEIGKTRTDKNGIAHFNKLNQKVSFAIAESGKDKNYLRLFDGVALSLSRFDVSGVGVESGLKGFLYLDRGVRRPGDKIETYFILEENDRKLPENTPIIFEFWNPKGKMVDKKVVYKSNTNHYSVSFKTKEEDITGNWNLKVKIGNQKFNKPIKIETIKPNRLKILSNIPEKITSDNNFSVKGQVKWLHGADAGNLKVDARISFKRIKTHFKNFSAYHFDNSYRDFNTNGQNLYSGFANANGKFTYSVNTRNVKNLPGFVRATIQTKAYEKGGDFSIDSKSFKYFPYKKYVGIFIPKGDKKRNMLLTDKKHTITFAAVNNNGKPIVNSDVEVKIYKVSWRWWWEKKADNFANYAVGRALRPIIHKKLKTNSRGIAQIPFEIKYPEWGRYIVVAKDISTTNGHISAKTLKIDWPGWAGKPKKLDPTFATILNFSTDKEKYKVGELANLTIPTAEGGRVLISIEKGNNVLDMKWAKTEAGKTKVTIPIMEDFSPNIYFNISVIYAQKGKKSDLPIRQFGVKPIMVYNPNTELKPVLKMDKTLEPQKDFELEVKEDNGKEMTYTISVVDEGLLDITNFKTPNPWKYFYAKEALKVKTWDVYDDLIGAYGGKIGQVFAIGGDAELKLKNNKKQKRFKAVNLQLGPFTLKAGKKAVHKLNMPRYIGSVRAMIVASNTKTKSYGKNERSAPVKKPLMILSSAPRKLVNGDEFYLPVTVFAMDKKVKNVKVNLKSNEFVKILGNETLITQFNKPGEKILEFRCKVLKKTGNIKFNITAKGGGEKVTEEINIFTDNPNSAVSKSQSFQLEKGERKTFNISYFGEKGSNKVNFELSNLPPINLKSRLDYLIRYPYGCLEQTTSNSFPQLYLSDLLSLDQNQKEKIETLIKKAVAKIERMQRNSGLLNYWGSGSYYNNWANAYAGHFMFMAEKKGYQLPYSFKENYLNYLHNSISNIPSDLSKAYSLYVLAIAKNPNITEMNKLRENNSKSIVKAMLSLAYVEIGQKEVAKNLLDNLSFNNWMDDSKNTYASHSRNQSILLLANLKAGNENKANNLSKLIIEKLNSKTWMSTQTTAFALIAMAEKMKFNKGKTIFAYGWADKENEKISTDQKIVILKEKKDKKQFTVYNNGNSTLYGQKIVEGIPMIGNEIEISNKLKSYVVFRNLDNKIIDVKKLKQGTNFYFEVEISNLTDSWVKDISLHQMLPSGWEIIPQRMYSNSQNSGIEYEDIRDDQVNYFFRLAPKKSKKFKILLNASYKGKYYLSGLKSGAMYDNTYLVKRKGFEVEVVD